MKTKCRADTDAVTAAETPQPKLRWYQYSLRTLLMMPVVCALVCWWYVDHRRVAAAREEYAYKAAQYEAGVVSRLDLCAASKRLCGVEEQSLFVGRVRARARHLMHVNLIEIKARAAIPVTMYAEGGLEAAQKQLEELVRLRVEAQQLLEDAMGSP